MYKLYLDTAQRYNKIVTLKKDSEVVGEKIGDIDIVQSVEALLEENNLQVKDIEEVIPNLGPGPSFTGLKIGATIANVLNWLNGKKTIEELDMPDYGRDPNITLKKF